jgi:hypothetical protein
VPGRWVNYCCLPPVFGGLKMRRRRVEPVNSRERLLTALRHKEPDRVPIDIGGTPTGIEVEAYDRLKELLGFKGETKTFLRDHVEIDEPILERFGIDTRYVRIKPPRGFTRKIEADNSYVD